MYDNHFKSEPQRAAMTSVYIVWLQAAKGVVFFTETDEGHFVKVGSEVLV